MVVMTVVVMMVVVVVSSSRSAAGGALPSGDLSLCAPLLSVSTAATSSILADVVKAGGGRVVAATATLARVLAQGGGADVCIAVVRELVVV